MIEPEIVQKGAFTIVGMEASFIGALSSDTNNFQVIPLSGTALSIASMKSKAGRTKPATASSSLGQNESVPTPTSYCM